MKKTKTILKPFNPCALKINEIQIHLRQTITAPEYPNGLKNQVYTNRYTLTKARLNYSLVSPAEPDVVLHSQVIDFNSWYSTLLNSIELNIDNFRDINSIKAFLRSGDFIIENSSTDTFSLYTIQEFMDLVIPKFENLLEQYLVGTDFKKKIRYYINDLKYC